MYSMPLVVLALFSLLIPPLSTSFADSDIDNAHNAATNKMIQAVQNVALGTSNAPPINTTVPLPLHIPIVFSAADSDKLVIGIDADELLYGVNYTEQDVQNYLGVDTPIDILYMSMTFSSDSSADITLDDLADECYPEVEDDFSAACLDLFEQLVQESVTQGTTNSTELSSSPSQENPCDVSAGSSTCYYYTRYISKCLPVHSFSRCNTYATIITGAGYALPTSLSDTTPPVITVPSSLTVRGDESSGALVRYTVTAIDDTDGTLTATCTPTSGSNFPFGDTIVTCTAQDIAGNSASEQFTVTVSSADQSTTLFTDDFENGLGRWIELGELEWRASPLDDYVAIPGRTTSNNVAEADDCDRDCILEMRNSVDLSSVASATLEFYRFVDTGLDRGEYLKVEAYDGASWNQLAIYGADYNTDDGAWNLETLDISDYTNSDFKIRFIVLASKSSEDVGVDEIIIRAITSETSQSGIFSDNFENGLDKWTTSGELEWETGTLDENAVIPGHTTSNNVAEADDCDRDCILEMRNSVDLSSVTSATLEFYRFVDASLDRGEYLKVEAYDGTSWNQLAIYGDDYDTDDDVWNLETLDISDYTNSDFKIRFIVLASSSSEDVGVDEIIIRAITSETSQSGIFSDNFENGLDKWTESGYSNWRFGTLDDVAIISGSTSSNNVAEADDCDADCILELRTGIDFSSILLASLEFDRYVDTGLDRGEYLKVEAYDGINWHTLVTYGHHDGTNDGVWNNEKIYLSGYDNVDFKIRFIAFASKSSEDVAVDNILLKIADPSLFSITLSNSSSVAENASGGFVNYNIKISGYSEMTPECTIDSGTFLSLSGFSTTISCIFDGARSYINHIFDYRIDPPISIYGGNPLVFAGYDPPAPIGFKGKKSTFTTGAMHSDVSGVIVSGHGVRISTPYNDTLLYKQNSESNNLDVHTLFSTQRGHGSVCGKYDAAFIPITEPNIIAPVNKVQKLNGDIFQASHSTLAETDYNASVWVYGKYSNNEGILLYKNATVNFGYCVITHMGITTNVIINGDSGAPIIRHTESDNLLVGSVKGNACYIKTSELPSNRYVHICDYNSDVRPFPHNFTVISAWENVIGSDGLNIDR